MATRLLVPSYIASAGTPAIPTTDAADQSADFQKKRRIEQAGDKQTLKKRKKVNFSLQIPAVAGDSAIIGYTQDEGSAQTLSKPIDTSNVTSTFESALIQEEAARDWNGSEPALPCCDDNHPASSHLSASLSDATKTRVSGLCFQTSSRKTTSTRKKFKPPALKRFLAEVTTTPMHFKNNVAPPPWPYIESKSPPVPRLQDITLPPNLVQRRYLTNWAIVLSGLEPSERRACSQVSRTIRYAGIIMIFDLYVLHAPLIK
jgi:hypothetical protein